MRVIPIGNLISIKAMWWRITNTKYESRTAVLFPDRPTQDVGGHI